MHLPALKKTKYLFSTCLDFKKSYNKSLRESDKFQKSRSKCGFLKQCTFYSVIPVTLRSRTKHKQFNERIQAEWENNERSQSLKQIKCALKDETIECVKLRKDTFHRNHTLLNSIPLVYRNLLQDRLSLKSESQYKTHQKQHGLKLHNLLFEANKPIPDHLKLDQSPENQRGGRFDSSDEELEVAKGSRLRRNIGLRS